MLRLPIFKLVQYHCKIFPLLELELTRSQCAVFSVVRSCQASTRLRLQEVECCRNTALISDLVTVQAEDKRDRSDVSLCHLPCERWRLCSRCRLKLERTLVSIILTIQQPTNRRSHSQGDAVAALLDQVDDVPVVERVDLNVVHGKDSVSHLKSPTALCW